MPTYKQALDKYGAEMMKKMDRTGYLSGITCTINKDGSFEIPQEDFDRAYRAAKGEKINPEEWDWMKATYLYGIKMPTVGLLHKTIGGTEIEAINRFLEFEPRITWNEALNGGYKLVKLIVVELKWTVKNHLTVAELSVYGDNTGYYQW